MGNGIVFGMIQLAQLADRERERERRAIALERSMSGVATSAVGAGRGGLVRRVAGFGGSIVAVVLAATLAWRR